jgi:hypothetical protein
LSTSKERKTQKRTVNMISRHDPLLSIYSSSLWTTLLSPFGWLAAPLEFDTNLILVGPLGPG